MYSSPDDMAARFGQTEMIRLTTPTGAALLTAPDPVPITRALTEASALIDSYIRRRYATPVTTVLPELARAAAMLARHDLMHGDDREPSKQAADERAAVLEWLKAIRDGLVLLDLAEAIASDESHATVQTRCGGYADNSTGYVSGGYFGDTP